MIEEEKTGVGIVHPEGDSDSLSEENPRIVDIELEDLSDPEATGELVGADPALGPNDVPDAPPEGYEHVIVATRHLQDIAVNILRKGGELGEMTLFTTEGIDYAGRIEAHAPDPDRGFNQWHKGVTLYMKKEDVVKTIKKPVVWGTAGGAVVGTAIAPGIGTVIGGALGYLSSKIFGKH